MRADCQTGYCPVLRFIGYDIPETKKIIGIAGIGSRLFNHMLGFNLDIDNRHGKGIDNASFSY